ncbi:MAG: hypothetical protein QOH26_876 [Actinomycetota bacterium]|nr:hypothetical protein [Actinomycetota bacterium]
MDLMETTRSEKRQSFLVAIALAAVVMLIAAPVVQAAVSAVRVTNTPAVKIKDSGGGKVNSEPVPDMGLTAVPGSDGALDVRVYAGGTGVLGVGDCSAAANTGALNVVTVPGNRVITAFIMTGTGTVTLTSEAVGGGLLPLNRFVTDASTPNFALSLPNGLGTTAPLIFTGTDGTSCQYTVLGEHLHPGE